MLWRNLRVSLITAAALTLAATGCASTADLGAARTSDLETPNITIAAVPSADLAAVYVAKDLGFFTDQGLNVTLKPVTSSRQIIEDQLKGKVDICAGAYPPYLLKVLSGARFTILAEGSIMTRSTRVLLTSPDSRLTSVSQLKGKTIGVEANNTIGTLLVSALLADNGISRSDVTIKASPGGYATEADRISRGEFDAAFFGEPFATQAQETHGDTPLADLNAGAATGLPIDGYIATQTWARAHPNTVAAFVRAIERAQSVADTNQAEARRAMAHNDSLPATVTDVMAIPGFPTGPVNTARIQREAVDMLQFGMIDTKYTQQVTSGALVRSMIAP